MLVVLLAFPLGIACAVYLEEYAGNSRFARWTRVNVRNLAGVPSVVYGLLGLGIFVKVLNGLGDPGADLQDSGFFLFRWIGNVLDWLSGNNGRNLIAGGLVLSALVLPIVIITTMEALAGRAAGDPRRGAGRRCDAVGDDPSSRPAGSEPGNPHRDGAGAGPGRRRGGADPHRRRRHGHVDHRQPETSSSRCPVRSRVCRR